jgi:hypothetical protein
MGRKTLANNKIFKLSLIFTDRTISQEVEMILKYLGNFTGRAGFLATASMTLLMLAACTSSVSVETLRNSKLQGSCFGENATPQAKSLSLVADDCQTATALSWLESSPQSGSATAKWIPSTSTLVTSQSIQFYSGSQCDTPLSDAVSLSDRVTDSYTFRSNDGGNYTFRVIALDKSLQALVSPCSPPIFFDKSSPTVTSITSSTADGNYRAGQIISIKVNFSEDVTVTGSPQITLETGTADAVVNYSGGSGTPILTFDYTIVAGHTSSDLDYISTNALTLNGGSIKDSAGNSAAVVLPTVGTTGSLGDNKSIVIDTEVPTISAIASQGTDFNTPVTVTFTIGSFGSTAPCSSSYLSLATSDSAIVKSSSVVWSGNFPNCAAMITPELHASGSVNVTVTVTDGAGNSASSLFAMVVRTAFVLGQSSSTSNPVLESSLYGPSGVIIVGNKLIVADTYNNRVLIWNTRPTTFGVKPNVVLGQSDFNHKSQSSSSISASTLSSPSGIYSDGSRLFVADYGNRRVLAWNSIPTTNGQPADYVLGQPNMSSNTQNNGGISGASMHTPIDVFGDGSRLYVVDGGNNRVMVWNTIPTSTATPANFALGQPNLTSNSSNNGGISASTLYGPNGGYTDGTRLFIADMVNNRILVWTSIPSASGQAANIVLGQPNFTSSTANNGGISASTVNWPRSVYSSGTRLFVADSGNNRLLVWNTIPTSNQQVADYVLGQPNFISSTANNGGISGSSLYIGNSRPGVLVDNGKLYVSDLSNNRVLVWNAFPSSNGQSADFAIGRPNLTSNINTPTATTLGARDVYSDGARLFVADGGFHRVLIYNTIPSSSGQAADVVLGQPDFISSTPNHGGLSASSMKFPASVFFDGTRLFVADEENHRVLIWNSLPTTNFQPADLVLGQPNFTTNSWSLGGASGMYWPTQVYGDGTRLYVSEQMNNRVLVWNTIPTTSGQAASFALGQPDLNGWTSNSGGVSASRMNMPMDIYVSGSRLFVVDYGNNRVLGWNTIPTTSGQAANLVLGQPNFTSNSINNGGISAGTFKYPSGISGSGTKLFVADSSNNRILIWNTLPTTSGQAADSLYGQSNFTSDTSNFGGLTAYGLDYPYSLFASSSKLFIPDTGNSRILVIPSP